ncbi:hypothetical protein PIROE2DRAFT_11344 [Piromyces sp. E2]|nr:hypothetical protein PIROE2DRAFT_11344 [Piromyces sp. E2]|eukprot:OUM62385.1 hypothetical protein PIROE2DRAFT_11344 [Piromyces sp. E2]
MKCENNSVCNFEGYGTYHGIINNYDITLDRVYYSKESNKNILSGIKLATKGINIQINNTKNNGTTILLKDKNNNIIDIIKPDSYNIPRIKISNDLYRQRLMN